MLVYHDFLLGQYFNTVTVFEISFFRRFVVVTK